MLVIILVAVSYSIWAVASIMIRDNVHKTEYTIRLIYLSMGIFVDVIMEVVIFMHIGGLVQATKNAEKLALLKRK